MPQNPGLEYTSVAVFFGILIFLLTACFVALTILIYYRDHVIIRRNTPNISFIVLVGAILTNIAGIFICIDITATTCVLYDWFVSIGFACIIGGIIAKEYRLYRIFFNRTATAVELKDTKLFMIVLALVIYMSLLVAAIWISGLTATIIQSNSNPFYLYYSCTSTNEALSMTFTIITEISFILFQIVALILAWKIRNITSAYSESYSVSVVIVVIICIDIILIPLYETLNDGTDSALVRRVIRLIKITITLLVILVFMFYYRYWKVYKYEKKIKHTPQRNFLND